MKEKYKILSFFIILLLMLAMILDFVWQKDDITSLKTTCRTLENELEYSNYLLNKKEVDSLKMKMFELKTILDIIEAETVGGTKEDAQAVMCVILNRMESSYFPNTPLQVIYQVNAFTPVHDGSLGTYKITERTIEGMYDALIQDDITDSATFFMQPSMAEEDQREWFENNLEYIKKIGMHSFYR